MSLSRLGVVGAGTMGAGIAQVSALGGFETLLHDPDADALEHGGERLRDALRKGAERGRWSGSDADAAASRVRVAPSLEELGGCELVIEAAPEDLALKRRLFGSLAAICGDHAVLATNTSSLSVTAIADEVPSPGRVCGMHFFNPPALMRLVEVVAGERTDTEALDAAARAARTMGREPVRCADSPGFIVNRCNRPYTLESLRILEQGIATHAEIDTVMRADGGYPMGPFELMDLIGIDVNLEVARSFHRQRPLERWRPHPIQERMVAEGMLGRKSGRGFYDYGGAEREETPPPSPEAREKILERVVSQLANEASFAVEEGVAAAEDVDAAMKRGLNHPRGPFEWLEALGAERVVRVLDRLRSELGEDRYRVAPSLRRRVG